MADKIRPINKRTHYKEWNAQNVLDKVETYIRILEAKQKRITWRRVGLRMWDVCTDLSIFDWWVDELSISRLKEMRTFLREAIKLGFNGYVHQLPAGQIQDPCGCLVDEITVMADIQHSALIACNSGLQNFLAGDIQMVCRLIQD